MWYSNLWWPNLQYFVRRIVFVPPAKQCHLGITLSVVRLSVCPSITRPRNIFTFSTSSPELLDGFWWNLVGMKYSWSLTSVVVFGLIHLGAYRGRAKIGHRGSPSSTNFFRQEGYSNKQNAKQWSRSRREEVSLFFVTFRSQIFHAFLMSFWTSLFLRIF